MWRMLRRRRRRKYLFLFICTLLFLLIFYQWDDVERKRMKKAKRIANTINRHEEKKDALERLHRNVQKAIESLQEPEDGCNGTTKVLICRNDFGQAGFGSILHRYAPCLQIAFGLGRVAVWNHQQYAHFGGYSRWMKPPTKSCAHLRHMVFSKEFSTRFNIKNRKLWNKDFTVLENDAKYLFLDIRLSFPYPPFVPRSVPRYLEVALLEIGVQVPWLWFYSQFMYYLIGRPNKYFTKVFMGIKSQLNFSHPSIGVHIRQDPTKVHYESKYIATENYANLSMKIYNNHLTGTTDKKIYVATDIRANVQKMKHLVPEDYRVISLPQKYQKIGINEYFKRNFNPDALESILLDVYFLWHSDFVICMHSSNICRLLEELKYSTTAFLHGRRVYSLHADYFCDFPGYYSYFTYLTTTRDRPEDCPKCMDYSKGELFTKTEHSLISDEEFLEVEFGKHRGLVRRSDLKPWPGYPHYETIVDLSEPPVL